MWRSDEASAATRYNFVMRTVLAACFLLWLCGWAKAQQTAPAAAQRKSVMVPAVIDHNRVIIDVEVALPNDSSEAIRAWIDNGNPDLHISRRIASVLALPVTCGDKECSSPPPKEITIGGMSIPLNGVQAATIPLRPVSAAAVLANGMSIEMNIPARVLRNYDVLIDFPANRFSIGAPGTIPFHGSSGKVRLTENGLIQIPSQIENKKYDLGLDIGSSISFLSEELFDKLAGAHPDWPHMTGAVGPANMWGADAETTWKLMRVDRVQFGPLFLTDVPFVAVSKPVMDFFEKRAGMPTTGLLGSDLLLGYRVGLDYAHSTVYFDIGRMTRFPAFDVVGFVLRPEEDGRYTILSVAGFQGKPSVAGVQAGDELVAVDNIPVQGATMGQVWKMLGGTPGQERRLTVKRAGKEFVVPAKVQHFLAALPDEDNKKKKK